MRPAGGLGRGPRGDRGHSGADDDRRSRRARPACGRGAVRHLAMIQTRTDVVADSVLELVGHTPLVRLRRIPPAGSAEILGKLESVNPAGSVKDRIALNMVEAAEREGRLRPGSTLVEPTSGNTGIGLAMVAAVKGYRLILTMPEDMSLERRKLLTRFGAELRLTPAIEGMTGAVYAAEALLAEHP